MKRLIYVLLMLAAGLQAMWAQDNNENYMVVEGAQWFYYFRSNVEGDDDIPLTFFFDGDTVINEKTYLKCYRTVYKPLRTIEPVYPYNNIITLLEPGTKLVACLRENEYREVCARYERNYREEVRGFCVSPLGFLIDTEFDEGEYVIYTGSDYMYRNCALTTHMHEKIFNFDTGGKIEINGKTYNYSTNTPANDLDEITYGHHYLIPPIGYYAENKSGVGHFSTFLSPLAFFRAAMYENSPFCTFSHYSMNGEIQYKSKWYREDIWTSVEEVKATSLTDNKWYNLQGQAFDEKPTTSGVYIHNGEKVVIK